MEYMDAKVGSSCLEKTSASFQEARPWTRDEWY